MKLYLRYFRINEMALRAPLINPVDESEYCVTYYSNESY